MQAAVAKRSASRENKLERRTNSNNSGNTTTKLQRISKLEELDRMLFGEVLDRSGKAGNKSGGCT